MPFDFKHLTMEQIRDYMNENASAAQKKAFIAAAYEEKPKRVAVKLYDKEGNPINYIDKDGKERQKMRFIDTKGETEKRFNLLKAKYWFANAFPDAVSGVPKKKTADKPTNNDFFGDWFDIE